MRVPNFLQDSDLSINSVYIGLVLYLVFFEYFDRDLVSSDPMRALLDLAEGALSFGFSNDETANVLAFRVLFLLVRLLFALLLIIFVLGLVLFFCAVVIVQGDLNRFLPVHIHVLVGSNFSLVLLR